MAKRKRLAFDKFLEVEWGDAVSNDGWVTLTEDTAPQVVISRGWLVKRTDNYLTLASSVYPENAETVGSTQTIPCGMIISSRELKVSNARSKLRHKVHPEPDTEEVHREPSKG